MDLDQLQSVRDRERQTDRLQQLRESFYEEAADFVADLRAERDGAAAEAEDPFDAPRVNRLTDRIRTAEQTLEAIYEKRVGKVVKAATFAAADLPAEAEGMTKEEAELFDTLVDEIEDNRAHVLDQLTGEGTPGTGGAAGDAPAGTGPGDEGSDGSVGAAEVMGEAPSTGSDAGDDVEGDAPVPDEPDATGDDAGRAVDEDEEAPADGDVDGEQPADEEAEGSPDGSAGDPSPEDASDVERELVRITDDVGPILGVDEREYDLSADDVVTLPAENARPLVERGAAERLE